MTTVAYVRISHKFISSMLIAVNWRRWLIGDTTHHHVV